MLLGAAVVVAGVLLLLGGVEGVAAGGVGRSPTKDSWIGGGNAIPEELREVRPWRPLARKCSGIKCSALEADAPLTPPRRRRS